MRQLTQEQQDRLVYLQDRLNAGQLTAPERVELEDLSRLSESIAAENAKEQQRNEATGDRG